VLKHFPFRRSKPNRFQKCDVQLVGRYIGSLTSVPIEIEEELFFKPGQLNTVIGQTGCGKTSLLMALFGETLTSTSIHYLYLLI